MRRSITRRLVAPMLAVAAAGASAPAPALAADCDKDYFDAGGVHWEVNTDGALDESGDDAYDVYGELTVIVGAASTGYAPPDSDADACTYEDGDRETAFPTLASSGGLAVSRKVYVPATGLRFARILDIVSNPTAAPITAELVFEGNYGTDSDTLVLATSSGDTVVVVGDAWAALDEIDFEDTKIASLWDSTLGTKADAADAFPDGPTSATSDDAGDGDDDAEVVYDDVTIGPGQTVIYMHIEHTGQSRADVQAFANAYGPGSEQFYSGLSAAERSQLRNWPPESDQDQDGRAFARDNCPEIANVDQIDTDGDGQGNPCDADDDNDGLSDAAEAELGLNPTSADTDGDGRADRVDACPRTAGTRADGCPQTVVGARRPEAISLRVTPRRDLRVPHRFRIRGTVRPPDGLSAADACGRGKVLVTAKAGPETISARKVDLRRDCTYRTRISFRRPQRFRNASRLRFVARFHGNARMSSAESRTVRVRVRR